MADQTLLDAAAVTVGRLEAQIEEMRDRFQCEIAEFRGYCGQLRAALEFALAHSGEVAATIAIRDALKLPVPVPRRIDAEAVEKAA
jgi:hypothetical protein